MRKIEGKYYYRFVCAIVLMAMAAGMFFFVWYRIITLYHTRTFLFGKGNLGMALGLYLGLYVVLGRLVRAFKIGVERKASVIAAQIITLFLADLSEVFLSLAIIGEFRFFWQFFWRYVLLFIIQAVVISFLTILMVDLYRKLFPPLQLLEIYGDYEDTFWQEVNNIPYKYHINRRMHYSQGPFNDEIGKYNAVLINNVPARQRNDILKLCFARDKRVYFVPKLSDILVRKADEINLFDTPLFLCRNSGSLLIRRWIKRFFDFTLSLLAIIVLSPIFLVTAIAIKLNDGGPVFYKQERVTIGGRRFMMIKFRSMIVDAEKDGRSRPAGENDDRITKVGKIIRPTRIDELPQLINILKGDMSIVGPRPERWDHVEKYTEEIPEFVFRQKCRGGLTGYAQVYGKYNTSALDKLKMDLVYITNFSLLLDLQIILETLKILLRKESTQGFSEQAITELHDYDTTDI